MQLSNREEANQNALYAVDFDITPYMYCKQHMPHLSEAEVKAFVENMPPQIKIAGIKGNGILVPIPNKRELSSPIKAKSNKIRFNSLLRFFKGLPDDTKICTFEGNEKRYLREASDWLHGYFEFVYYENSEEHKITTIGSLFENYLMNLSYGGDGRELDVVGLDPEPESVDYDVHRFLTSYSYIDNEIVLTFSDNLIKV